MNTHAPHHEATSHNHDSILRLKPNRPLVLGLLLGGLATSAVGQVSLTTLGTPYTQNFNTLAVSGDANAWADNSTLTGWYAQFSAAPANPTLYRADNNGTGALRSMGSDQAAERALGSSSSGTPDTIYFAVRLVNNTGLTIDSLAIRYTGEQWRNGGNASAQTLAFEYRVAGAGAVTDANTPSADWSSASALDFTSPVTGATAVQLDGNAAANRTAKSATLAVTVNPGQEVWLRWKDIDDGGNDHTLAVDDISVTPSGSLQSTISAAQPGGEVVVPPGEYSGIVINQPLTLRAATPGTVTINGASPALTVNSVVSVSGLTFATATADPTILVNSGGALTMRNCVVHESTSASAQPAIRLAAALVNPGTADLGTVGSLGVNTINIRGAGSLVRNETANNISAIGNTWQQDGAAITSNFTIEDNIYHALDGSGLGLTTWVDGNAYVTQNSGSLQRGIDAVVSGGRVNVQTGAYIDNPDATAKAIVLVPGSSPGQVIIMGDLTLSSDDTLEMELNGTAAGTTYDQLVVDGFVDLGGASLNVTTTGFAFAECDQLTLIDNDDIDAVTGTFAGLPAGTTVSVGAHTFRIRYDRGTGNDVVLVKDGIAPFVACLNPTVHILSGNPSVTVGAADVFNAAGSSDNCGGPVSFVSVSPSTFICAGVYSVTVTGTDVNDNLNTCTATVTVINDNPAPTVVYVDDGYVGLPNGTAVNFPYSGAGTHTIGCDAFASVQAGINAVAAGGTVNVAAGTYAEAVNANKSVMLLGANAGVAGCGGRGTESTIAGGLGLALDITSDDVTVDGFEMTGGIGIRARSHIGVVVRNNKVTAGALGIDAGTFVTTLAKNVALQGNCVALTTQGTDAAPTIGVRLTTVSGAQAAVVSGNSISGAFIGYLLYDALAAAPTVVSGGTITGVKQGVDVLNFDPAAPATLRPSTFGVSGVSMAGFTGSHPTLLGNNFHAGVYVVTIGADPAAILTGTLTGVTIDGTGKISSDSSGVYLADFSGGAGTRIDVDVVECVVQNNLNRGIFARGANAVADVTRCTLTSNGADPFGAGGNDGYGIIARTAAKVKVSEAFITNPAAQVGFTVHALLVDLVGTSMTVSNSSIDRNGNGKLASQSGGVIDASGNWWGGNSGATIAANLVGVVDYTPWLNIGTDTSGTAGFQGDFAVVIVDDDSPQTGAGGRIQEGIDLTTDPGTVKIASGTYTETPDTSLKSISLVLGATPGMVTLSGNLTLDANDTLVFDELNGTTPGVDQDQVVVNGTVNLGGATLTGASSGVLDCASLALIANDDTEAVVGTFAGMAGGTTVTVGGVPFRIFYDRGDGNDVILVKDVTPPTLACVNISVPNDPGLCSAVVNYGLTPTDNCAPAPALVCTPPSGSLFSVGPAVTVNCTATDGVGLSTTCSFTVTVIDAENPTLSASDATVTYTGTPITLSPALFSVTAADNCGSPGVTFVPAVVSCPGVHSVILTATDASANSVSLTKTLTVTDGRLAPSIVYVDDNYPAPGSCTMVNFPDNGMTGPHEVGYNAFPTIQAALNAVAGGGQVMVAAGVYAENISIIQPVSMVGPNDGINGCSGARVAEAVIHPATSDPDPSSLTSSAVIYIDSDGVTIKGFTIDGNNPSLTSGIVLRGEDLDSIEAIGAYGGVNDVTVANNVIKNFSYAGLDFYNYFNGGAPTAGNVIQDNKLTNIGHVPYGWGFAVLIYNNFYVEISGNCMNNVRLGIQTGNYFAASLADSTRIHDNTISSTRRGIWHNLAYGSASPFSIHDNTVTSEDETGAGAATRWDGIMLSSLFTGSEPVVEDNIVTGTLVTQTTVGYQVWNCPAAGGILVSGGSVSSCNYGVWLNNYDGFGPSDGDSTELTLSGVTVSGSTLAGVYVKDNPLNGNGAFVLATVTDNCSITGAGSTGVMVEGADARARVINNLSSITGNAYGVDVDGGKARIETTKLSANTIAGIRVRNGAIVDAGDCAASDVTGLGSSTGGNDLSGYGFDNVAPWAILDENAAGGPDVLAQANNFGAVSGDNIEAVLSDDSDGAFSAVIFSQSPAAIQCPSDLLSLVCLSQVPTLPANLADFQAQGGVFSASAALFSVVENITVLNANDRDITRTFTLTDSCSQSATCTQTIKVRDTVLPIIACAPNATVNTAPGLCSAVVTGIDPTFSDNCAGVTVAYTLTGATSGSGSGSASGQSFNTGVTLVTYTATDAANNTATCSLSVTVTDNQAPTITGCPLNIVVPSSPTSCGQVVTWTPPSASDNCAILTFVASHNSGDTFPVGVTPVTYTATDTAGLVTVCSFTVTVQDTTPPTFTTCPANFTIYATNMPGDCLTNVSFTTLAGDNCPGVTVVCVPPSGFGFPLGTTTVSCYAQDAVGNQSASAPNTCTFDVTVVDVSGDVSVACWRGNPTSTSQQWAFGTASMAAVAPDRGNNPFGGSQATIVWNPLNFGTGWHDDSSDPFTPFGCFYGAWDLDAGDSITLNIANVPSAPAAAYKYVRVQVTQMLQPPLYNYADVALNVSATLVRTNVSILRAAGSGGNWVVHESVWRIDAPCPSSEQVILTVPDPVEFPPLSGNFVQSGILVDQAVVDTLCLNITCPGPIVDVADFGQCSKANVTWANPTAGVCEIASVVCVPPSGSTFPVGAVQLVTCTVTDVEGGTYACGFTVTINDTQAPVITCPSPVTVACAGMIPPPDFTGGSVTDNCDPGGSSVLVTWEGDVISAQTCVNRFTVTRTYKATDVHNNSSTCTQTITVDDQTVPVITTLAGSLDRILECSDLAGIANALLLQPSATDNCGGLPAIQLAGDTSTPDPMCPNGYVRVRTWNFTDECGNTSAGFVQTITVRDTTAPVLSGLPPLTDSYQCYASVPVPPAVTAMDNCSGSVPVIYNEVQSSPGGSCNNVIMRTWSAADSCGNPVSFTQTITVNDTLAPTATQGAIAACYLTVADANQAALDATTALLDNCDPAPSKAVFTAAAVDCATAVVIRVSDSCGNFTDYTYPVRVDNTAPTATQGAIASCYLTVADANQAALDATTALLDNCDPAPSKAVFTSAAAACVTAVVIRVSDSCGNFTDYTYPVRVDNTAPVIASTAATQNAGALDVKNGANDALQGLVTITVVASDDCGLSGIPTLQLVNGMTTVPLTGTEGPPGTFTYGWTVDCLTPNGTWTATVTASDGCTPATSSFTINVNTLQVAGSVQLQDFLGTCPAALPRTVTFKATDIGGFVIKTWTLPVVNGPGGTYSYTLTGVPAATVNLSAKTAWTLRRRLPVTFAGCGATVDFTGASGQLKGGDLTGDNRVNLPDYSLLAANFGKCPYLSCNSCGGVATPAAAVADINGDGTVNVLDYSILASNWFTAGDPE